MRGSFRVLVASLFLIVAPGFVQDSVAQAAPDPAAHRVRFHASPYFGVGARGRRAGFVGPQFYAGASVETDLGVGVRPALNGAGWTFPLTCIPSGDPLQDRLRCANTGWMMDAGANLQLGRGGKLVVPYIGAGLGAMKAGDTYASANARIGSDVGARSGAGLRAELRYQQVFGALNPSVILFSMGARFTLAP